MSKVFSIGDIVIIEANVQNETNPCKRLRSDGKRRENGWTEYKWYLKFGLVVKVNDKNIQATYIDTSSNVRTDDCLINQVYPLGYFNKNILIQAMPNFLQIEKTWTKEKIITYARVKLPTAFKKIEIQEQKKNDEWFEEFTKHINHVMCHELLLEIYKKLTPAKKKEIFKNIRNRLIPFKMMPFLI